MFLVNPCERIGQVPHRGWDSQVENHWSDSARGAIAEENTLK